jgi:hypothetical protein
MKTKFITCLMLLAFFGQAQAAEVGVTLSIGAAVKNISEIAIGQGKSSLSIVAEGAGKIVAQGKAVRFHALCSIVDTLMAKEVVSGVGDCEFKSVDGGTLYAHFQTMQGYGDRGHLTFSGGTQSFARVTGSVPVEVSVNPTLVGKMVFFVENLNDQPSAK